MKHRPLALVATAVCFVAASCEKKTEAQNSGTPATPSTPSTASTPAAAPTGDPLENFKAKAKELEAYLHANGPKANNDPTAGMTMMKEAKAKMDAISTEGLPADLKEAFDGMKGSVGKLVDALKNVPLDKLAGANPLSDDAKDPQAMEALTALMTAAMTIGPEIETNSKKLSEAAKKHGIDLDLDPDKGKGGPGDAPPVPGEGAPPAEGAPATPPPGDQ